jgi:hypothetical protein
MTGNTETETAILAGDVSGECRSCFATATV